MALTAANILIAVIIDIIIAVRLIVLLDENVSFAA